MRLTRLFLAAALCLPSAFINGADANGLISAAPSLAYTRIDNETHLNGASLEAQNLPQHLPGNPSTTLEMASIGALFSGGKHFCSASVVHSPLGNLVLTAAHCVQQNTNSDANQEITFVPGYHDGISPYGEWTVTKTMVSPGWTMTSDPDLDFAFLSVEQTGNPRSVESITGANSLGVDYGFSNTVMLSGYPDTSETPTTCQNTTTEENPQQMRIDCAGFPDGTSGGPWITEVDSATGLGKIIGVIGGFQLGGDSPDVSYSSYFDSKISSLYQLSIS